MIEILGKPIPKGTPLIYLVLAGETADRIQKILDEEGFRSAVRFVEILMESQDLNAIMVCQHIQDTRYQRNRQVPAPKIGDIVTIRYGKGPDDTATGYIRADYGCGYKIEDPNNGRTYVGELENV